MALKRGLFLKGNHFFPKHKAFFFFFLSSSRNYIHRLGSPTRTDEITVAKLPEGPCIYTMKSWAMAGQGEMGRAIL